MAPKRSLLKIVGFLVAVFIILPIVMTELNGGIERQAHTMVGEIHNQVADDAVKQYEIAKRSGSAMGFSRTLDEAS